MIRRATALAIILLAALPWPVHGAELSSLIIERLSHMKDVAAWKHAKGVAVEDLARERVVIKSAAAAAAEKFIGPETITPFFTAQIEAAKAIQRCWLNRWDSGSALPPTTVPDLVNNIRPELLRLGNEIVAAIAADLSQKGRVKLGDPSAILEIDCLSAPAAGALIDALAQVRLSS